MGRGTGWQSETLGPISNSFLLGPGCIEPQGSRFPHTPGVCDEGSTVSSQHSGKRRGQEKEEDRQLTQLSLITGKGSDQNSFGPRASGPVLGKLTNPIILPTRHFFCLASKWEWERAPGGNGPAEECALLKEKSHLR